MDAEAWQDLEPLETSEAPEASEESEESEATRRTLLQMLEERSDADVMALTADRLVCDLDFVLQALVQAKTRHHGADTDWRAAQRLRRYAHKHEDAELLYWTAIEVEHFQRVLPQYAAQCRRSWVQWSRHWDALLKYRLPEDLHEADQRAHLRRNIRLCVTPCPTISCMAMKKRAKIAYLI
jgi:hypothetical protein